MFDLYYTILRHDDESFASKYYGGTCNAANSFRCNVCQKAYNPKKIASNQNVDVKVRREERP